MTKEFERFLEVKRSYCVDKTVLVYSENVFAFIKWCEMNDIMSVNDIDSDLLIKYVTFLREVPGLKNVSIISYIRSVKVFLKWLYDFGYLKDDCAIKINLPKSDSNIVQPLTSKEVSDIDETFDCSGLGMRNYCIFHLMLDSGLRLGEVIDLKVSDIKKGQIVINDSKGNKSRIVLCPKFLNDAINFYISQVGIDDEQLFLTDDNAPLTIDTIKNMFTKLKLRSGVKRVHAHLCRHTFATSYILGGGNMEMLRLLMGHSSYNVTQNYLHLANQSMLIRTDVYELDTCFFENYNNRKLG